MNKLLAMSILGLGLSGAALILSVSLLFKSPTENFELMFTAGSAGACAVFAVSSLVLRKRFNHLIDKK
ncbi:hypothetical protein CEY02_08775 [Bacillus pumilus]|uniref:Uncharacterized protein n=1 Tax=Bacillus pumilus TaxID=1408 RepID=A0A2A5IV50_BACPU|nr:hypothetical protein [Bacillus pumilus]PCK21254.1 hypothetical protein CEY02_08775 [Bacillus pumilus]